MDSPVLVDEAMKKAAVAWLTVPGQDRAYLVWCAWVDGALYLVSGPGEQAAPGLADTGSADVTARGDHGGRIVTWSAAVSRLVPGAGDWDAVTPQLAAKRLNAPTTAEQTVQRWAAECVVHRLVPAGEAVSGRSLPDGSLAAPPPPSPAARTTKRPFRLHRVRRPPA